MKCFVCGKEFEPGNRPDGLPNGCGFELRDGTIFDVCTDCITKMFFPKKEICDGGDMIQ